MSFATLLSGTCDVIHIGPTGSDRVGTPLYGEVSRSTGVPFRLDQLSSDEDIVGRDGARAEYRAFFMPSVILTAFDQVEAGGVTYRVVGPVAEVAAATPLHHLEARLERESDWIGAYP